ncbi:hypothetical protein [Nonlabens xylanidelens]|nr:hypothetical protein [Nonlabens xylanidelens]
MKKQKLLGIMLCMIPFYTIAQNDDDAVKLFENNSKFSFSIKYQNLYWSNEGDSSVFFEAQDTWVPALGLEYNFSQRKNWNWSVGFFVRNMVRKDSQTFLAEDVGLSTDLTILSSESPHWSYHLPVDLSYIKEVNDWFFISGHVGLEVMYYAVTEGDDLGGSTGINNITRRISFESEVDSPITGGANIGLGFYLKSKNTMWRIDMTYHYHFVDIIDQAVLATNLDVSPDTVTQHNWTGDYLSFSINIFPRKGWIFKSKK